MEQNKCGVYLISGFLGSGKTTLLTNLLKTVPDGEKAAVLMNEFGKAGVDGTVIRTGGLEIIEISRGSIFCSCAKGDFLRGLYHIFRECKPSVLFIEASGVADTTDMKRDMGHGMLHDYYYLKGNICVVDAQHYKDWSDLFCAVPRQIEAASLLVLNKTDLAMQETLDEIEAELHGLNPESAIIRAQYGRIPWSSLTVEKDETDANHAIPLPEEEEWEKYIEKALNDMDAHLAPPDKLASQSIFWEGSPERFKTLLEKLPDDIVRAKGYFKSCDGKWQCFNIVGNSSPTYSEPDRELEASHNLAVFIRKKHARKEIPSLFETNELKMLEVRFG